MQFQNILVCLTALVAVGLASPTIMVKARDPAIVPEIVKITPEGDFNITSRAIDPSGSGSGLVARGGWHTDTVYTGGGCTGTGFNYQENFGCGGACWSSNVDIWSTFLNQQAPGNPSPTADFFSGTNCNGNRVAHAGIYNGQYSGCTTFSAPARSYILYWNC